MRDWLEDPLPLPKDLRIHPQPKTLPTRRSALRHKVEAINFAMLTEACTEIPWSDPATDGASKNFRKRFY